MGGTVLVVDDEVAVRDLLAANLQRAGYRVMIERPVSRSSTILAD